MTFIRFFFPINLNDTHWVAGIVDMKRKKVFILDSMSGNQHNRHRALILQVACGAWRVTCGLRAQKL